MSDNSPSDQNQTSTQPQTDAETTAESGSSYNSDEFDGESTDERSTQLDSPGSPTASNEDSESGITDVVSGGDDQTTSLLERLNDTVETIETYGQTVVEELTQLTDLLRREFQDLRAAIQDNTQAQAELELIDHMRELSSVGPQIEALEHRVETSQAALREQTDQINQEYQRKHNELNQRAHDQIRELGSHIFAIDEQQFTDGIAAPFIEQVPDLWPSLEQHNESVRADREATLDEAMANSQDTFESFVDRRASLAAQVDPYLISYDVFPATPAEPTRVQLPYYFIEFEFDGDTHKAMVFPSEMRTTDGDWYTLALDQYEGLDQLMEERGPIDHENASSTSIQAEEIIDAVEPYGRTDRLGFSYTETLAEALPDRITLYTTGGDDQ